MLSVVSLPVVDRTPLYRLAEKRNGQTRLRYSLPTW